MVRDALSWLDVACDNNNNYYYYEEEEFIFYWGEDRLMIEEDLWMWMDLLRKL